MRDKSSFLLKLNFPFSFFPQKMDLNADNKISLDEFLQSCHQDDGLMESIGVFQTIF